MGVFDRRTTRRPPKGNEHNLDLDGIGEVKEEVPEVDSTLSKLEQALESDMTQGGCGCWG